MNTSNMTFGMKVVIVIFAVILVLSLMLPFFSSCGTADTAQQASSDRSDTASMSTASDVDATYSSKVQSYSAALDKDPEDLLALANMGNTYMEWGDTLQGVTDGTDAQESHIRDVYGAAVPYFSAYLERQDSDAVRVYLAASKFYSGDEQGAISDLEQFTAEDPDFSPAWYNLGVFYREQGKYSEAGDAFNSAISADEVDSYNMGIYSSYALSLLSAMMDASAAVDASADYDASGYLDEYGLSSASDLADASAALDTDGMTGGGATTPDEADSSSAR